METASGVAAGRGGSHPMPPPLSSQSARKEWRAISEHSVRNSGNEELERLKLGQSDERTIYEHGGGPVDFCSITMNKSLDNDILQGRLHSVSRQREELQQMEIELRVHLVARSEIMGMQNNFDTQINEHANAAAKLKEQLQQREHTIHELEMKMEEKDGELRAIKIDNEAAWAKEDLLREQNKELATFRREHDNSEAERAQHLKQIHDLKEHIQEKERHLLELEEQHRVAQEAILYKDEQLREAQSWIARVQEMDALQLTTNHSLQAELRERTEQFNQFWLGCQRQFADMERLHMHAIQQLQLELAEARERAGIYTDESRMFRENSKDVSPYGQNQGNQLNVGDGITLSTKSGVGPNGNVDAFSPFVSTGNASIKSDQVPGVPLVPSSLLGMGAYLPPGQVAALHPFVMHQPVVPHSVPSANSHVSQSHLGHFESIPALSSQQQWHNQQVVSEGSQISNQNQYLPSQTEQNIFTSDAHYDYELSPNGQVLHSDYLNAHIEPRKESGSLITTTTEEAKVLESNDERYLVAEQPQQQIQESSQFHDLLTLDSLEQKSENKGQNENIVAAANHSHVEQGLSTEQPWSAANTTRSDGQTHSVNSTEATDCNSGVVVLPEAPTRRMSNSQTLGKIPESALLDERSLLTCIVRAIPAGSGGHIRISSTLPNRLGKMLAPLHWHDYKKKYGKLDDFLAGHPELFVIEGDFIQLREGAQEIISATAAVAKVAAAAAASGPYSSLLPSVAVTPVAQAYRLKKVPSLDLKPAKTVPTEPAITTSVDACDKPSQVLSMQYQQSNGVCDIVQGPSLVKILSRPKDSLEFNGLQTEIRSGNPSVHLAVGNGANPDRTGLTSFQNKGSSNGRYGSNFGGKQQGRTSGAALTSRR